MSARMRFVYVVAAEPYHENGRILAVTESAEEAYKIAAVAPDDHDGDGVIYVMPVGDFMTWPGSVDSFDGPFIIGAIGVRQSRGRPRDRDEVLAKLRVRVAEWRSANNDEVDK